MTTAKKQEVQAQAASDAFQAPVDERRGQVGSEFGRYWLDFGRELWGNGYGIVHLCRLKTLARGMQESRELDAAIKSVEDKISG